MIVKWKVEKWHDKIWQVECVSETEKTVTIAEGFRRETKISNYHKYFDTWVDAHAFLRERLESSIRRSEASLVRDRETLAKVRAMYAPEGS